MFDLNNFLLTSKFCSILGVCLSDAGCTAGTLARAWLAFKQFFVGVSNVFDVTKLFDVKGLFEIRRFIEVKKLFDVNVFWGRQKQM